MFFFSMHDGNPPAPPASNVELQICIQRRGRQESRVSCVARAMLNLKFAYREEVASSKAWVAPWPEAAETGRAADEGGVAKRRAAHRGRRAKQHCVWGGRGGAETQCARQKEHTV